MPRPDNARMHKDMRQKSNVRRVGQHHMTGTSAMRTITNSIASAADPIKSQPLVGRNEPCPCGSGMKYKKCHGDGKTPAAAD